MGRGHRHHPFADASATPSYAPDTAVRPRHCAVHLALDLPRHRAAGHVTITFECTAATPPTRSIELDAVSLLDVAVRMDGGDDAPPFEAVRYDGKKIRVTWATAFALHEQRTITVAYAVEEPITGLLFDPDRRLLVMADNETERARYWLPCVDYPVMRPTWEMHLRVPVACTAIANGCFVGEMVHDSDGTKTVSWRLDVPCPSYLVCFVAGDLFKVDDGEFEGAPVAYFAPRDVPMEWIETSFKETKPMLAWLTKKLNQPLPFPKYYQFAAGPMSGAMENISLVSWGTRYLVDAKLAPERAHLFNLVNIHEMAHSFFGDMLVIRHFEHAWLKESWATYIEACWVEDHKGLDHFQWELIDQLCAYTEEVESYARPIVTRTFNSSWLMFDGHLYPGGSLRLHMLRKLLGEAAFWKGVQNYVARYLGKVVETEQFRNCLEEVSGRNLTRFFDEWFYGKGYPMLSIEYEHNDETHVAKVSISQTQPPEHTVFGINIPVVITATLPDGTTHTTTTNVDMTSPNTRKATSMALLPPGAKTKMVRIDPDMTLLCTVREFHPGEDILGNVLTHAPDVISRVRAVTELVKTGGTPALEKVCQAMKTEPFYGVRIQAAKALASSHSVRACEILAEMLDREQDPMALWEIAACCTTVEPCVRDALLRLLKRSNLPYRAHMSVLKSLGKHRHEDDLELLVKVATKEDPSPHSLIREGALVGLGFHGHKQAVEILREHIVHGMVPEGNRPFVIAAYVQAVARHPIEVRKQAADDIAQILRDASWRVRDAAMDALTRLGATDKIGDLENMRAMVAAQDIPLLERAIHDIKASTEAAVPEKVKAEIEDLQKLVRKLADQVAMLETKAKMA